MSRLVELREQFEKKAKEQADLLAKGDALTQEDVLKAEGLNGELDKLQGEIEGFAKVAKMQDQAKAREALLSRPTNPLPHPGTGVSVVGMQAAGETVIETGRKGTEVQGLGPGLMSDREWRAVQQPEYKEAFLKYLRCGGTHGLNHVEMKTLSEGSDTSGGFTVPEDFLANVIMKRPTPVRVMNYVQSFNTTRDSLSIPKVNYSTDDLYTTGVRATWTGEIPASATTARVTDPVFGAVRVPVYTAMLSMPVTNDLLEDSAVALLPWAEARFAETIELLIDNMILNGTGVGQPFGILANPGGAQQPASVSIGNPATADNIIKLGWTLPEQYDDEARWVFNKTNFGQALAQLKDSNNRYIWGEGYQDSGLSPTIKNRELLGYPVNYSGFMPNQTANAFPVIFGDFRGYYLVRRVGFSVQVLRELYAETNQILLLGRVRFGGQVAEEWRLKCGKNA
jgi:HK97 family phage major capsid protein